MRGVYRINLYMNKSDLYNGGKCNTLNVPRRLPPKLQDMMNYILNSTRLDSDVDGQYTYKGSIANNKNNLPIGEMEFPEKITFENQTIFVNFYRTYF